MSNILPRPELIALLCTCDGKGKEAKRAQLDLVFASIDKIGDSILEMQANFAEIQKLRAQHQLEVLKLADDRDKWEVVARQYEARLAEENLL